MFKDEGLSFSQWMKYNRTRTFSYSADLKQQLDGIRNSINEDLNYLLTSSISNDIKRFINYIDVNSLDKKTKLIFKDYQLKTIDGKDLSGDELQDFVGKFSNYMSKNIKWTALEQNNETNFLDLKDHFKSRLKGLKELKSSFKKNENCELTIKLFSRKPEHDLFLGDYCQSCISPVGINGQAIIDSLMHTVDQTVELIDSSGKTVGKAKVLWIKDMSNGGKPALLVNGFEMTSYYQNSKTIRDEMTNFLKEYAKKVAKNQDSIRIYVGETYQKVPIEDLKEVNILASLIGKTRNNTYHLDSFASTLGNSWPKNLDNSEIPLKLKVLGDA